jgi:hypothetical protein
MENPFSRGKAGPIQLSMGVGRFEFDANRSLILVQDAIPLIPPLALQCDCKTQARVELDFEAALTPRERL